MTAAVQDVIMLFGDSITQLGWTEGGFGARLADVYSRKLDVINRGLAGYNTEWAIPVLEQCLANQHEQQHAPKIRIFAVWFGANDACIKPSPQHIPLPKFIENIKHIVDLIQSPKSPRSPPLALDRTFDTTKAYADGVKEAAVACQVAVVDIWTELWKAAGGSEPALSKFLCDGLHLTPDGYGYVFPALVTWFAFFSRDLLIFCLVRWTQVNWDDPGPSVKKRESMQVH
ncbi:SGNH hydrolase-type esterase domain-containing protein [Mycena sp. CBHHK59/15]|nr:SGNH hydrolase-type esterase domain-containing protein [Mycena sp. CBHHK59/15]